MVRRSCCKSLPGQGRGEQGAGWRQVWFTGKGLEHSGITPPPDVGTNFLQERTRGDGFKVKEG